MDSWYDAWMRNPESDRFYLYLQNEDKEYVGEIAYHYDGQCDIYICDVIILAKFSSLKVLSNLVKIDTV